MVTKNCSTILRYEQFSTVRGEKTIGIDAISDGLKTISARVLVIFFGIFHNSTDLLMDKRMQFCFVLILLL